MLPVLSIEAVLIDPDEPVAPPREPDSLEGHRLGDITLAALVNAAAYQFKITNHLEPPEEYCGNESTDFY